MKIKGKLTLMVLPLLLASLAAVAYLSLLVKNTANESEEIFYDELYTVSSTLINADRDFYQAYCALLQNAALTKEGESNSQYVDDYNENIKQTLERVGEVDEIVEKNKDLEEFEKDGMTLCSQYEVFEENINQLESLYDVGAKTGDLTKFDECFNATRDSISNMEDIIEDYAEASAKSLQASIRTSIIGTVILVLITFVLAIVLAVYFTITIRKSVEGISEELNIMASKDLTKPIKILKGKDEIAQLSRSAADLREQILSMMYALSNSSSSLQKSSRLMSDSTKESVQSVKAIDVAAGELANTASQQASDATMMAAEVQTVNDITEQSIESTTSLENACKDIENVTHSGMQIVNELTGITNQSQKAFNNIFDAINGIDEKAQTISTASDMISDIASQTNLLSLNASIEAARAGEAGRGFAVVADEIRQLAEQSASSVETINSMIAALLQSAEEAKKQSELVKKFVKDQMNSVDQTQEGFEEIVASVNIVNEDVAKLRDINDNLGSRVQQITGLIESYAAASEQNAATSQELSATTTSVTENITSLEETENSVTKMSDDLNGIVSEYHI